MTTPLPTAPSSGPASLVRSVLAGVQRVAVLGWCACALVATRLRRDDGMSTAEYAVGTVAAVAFAAVLYKVVRSDAVQSALTGIIRGALDVTL